ncbi:MAG: response regulator [Pseudomonadota bacterium]
MHENSAQKAINVLLVEDNPGDARLVQEAIKDSGVPADFHHAKDGAEGLEFVRREGAFSSAPVPDLILLDLNLPKKSGRDVLNEIKSDRQLESIPVVVLTISDAEQDIVDTFHLKADHYVAKPVDAEKFLECVRRFTLASAA